MVEPGGAVALAALMAGKVDVKGKVAVAVLSGGNVDPESSTGLWPDGAIGGPHYPPQLKRRDFLFVKQGDFECSQRIAQGQQYFRARSGGAGWL